jgi:hypothetical protein
VAGVAALNDTLQRRLLAARVDPAGLRGVALDPWEAWLRLRARWGRRATLVDLYEPEAAFQGIGLEQLTAADRERLKVLSRHVRRDRVEVVPGSGRSGDPHEVNGYDPAWPGCFGVWHRRLATKLGDAAARIDHIGSTPVNRVQAVSLTRRSEPVAVQFEVRESVGAAGSHRAGDGQSGKLLIGRIQLSGPLCKHQAPRSMDIHFWRFTIGPTHSQILPGRCQRRIRESANQTGWQARQVQSCPR